MTTSLGLFHPGTSIVHRAPAGLKLALLVAAAVGTHWLGSPARIGYAALGVAALYALARIPVRVAWAQVRPLLVLMVVLGAFQTIVAGWRAAVVIVGALVLLAALAALVTLTTRTTALVDTVVRVLGPLRHVGVDPERIGLLLALGIRAVPVVAGFAAEVRDAQRARGLTASPTAFAVPLIVRSLRHADAQGDALLARGFED
ncbi:MAG TPA: energy-coupling factor transporter transmembrane protein EcfT [Marmoricola sp.]